MTRAWGGQGRTLLLLHGAVVLLLIDVLAGGRLLVLLIVLLLIIRGQRGALRRDHTMHHTMRQCQGLLPPRPLLHLCDGIFAKLAPEKRYAYPVEGMGLIRQGRGAKSHLANEIGCARLLLLVLKAAATRASSCV